MFNVETVTEVWHLISAILTVGCAAVLVITVSVVALGELRHKKF